MFLRKGCHSIYEPREVIDPPRRTTGSTSPAGGWRTPPSPSTLHSEESPYGSAVFLSARKKSATTCRPSSASCLPVSVSSVDPGSSVPMILVKALSMTFESGQSNSPHDRMCW